jgi:hypothetical protein
MSGTILVVKSYCHSQDQLLNFVLIAALVTAMAVVEVRRAAILRAARAGIRSLASRTEMLLHANLLAIA